MTAQRFADRLNLQICNDSAAHQQYVSAVVNRAAGA